MIDFVMIGVLCLMVGSAIAYIVKVKKSGIKCIGCPSGGNCSHKHESHTEGGCGCGYIEK